MELEHILSKDCVVPCAKVTSKRQLLQLAADRAAEKTGLDAHLIFHTLVEREKCGSTGLGNGIAVPHGKMQGIDRVLGLFIRLDRAIDFDAVDEVLVDLVFVLLAPQGAGADHLKALSRIARTLREEGLVEQLRATREADKLYALLVEPQRTNNAA
ncbi:MAG TPA: PTS IIA-like nitrogen regulatory protein PtsN [Devosiaceae bacterium]|nr:PTS IIA-like nitrogen regulatory protein PtsN [Devosiaceae bacterium]